MTEKDAVESDHYLIKGKRFVRVTSLLRARNLVDFSKIPERDRQFYLDRGTANHDAWQKVEEGVADQYNFDPRVQSYLPAHARFLRETGFRALPGGIELQVKMTWEDLALAPARPGEETGIAGRLDRLGTIQNRLLLVDYKTTDVHPATALQTAIYLLGLNYKFQDVERRGVAFRSNGTYQFSEKYPFANRDEVMHHISEYRKERNYDAIHR